MNIEKINLDDFVLTGGGMMGSSYNHKTNPLLMLKMYPQNFATENTQEELQNSQLAYEHGIPSPRPGQMVTDGTCYGVLYERIPNKKSYARAIADDPSLLEPLAISFAQMLKELHAIKADTTKVVSMKGFMRKALTAPTELPQEDREWLLQFLETVEDKPYCVHGDAHYGNVLLADGKRYWIDLGNFSYGDPRFDLSMLYFVTHFTTPELHMHLYHFPYEQGLEFWNIFASQYYGRRVSDDEAFEDLRQFIALRMGMFCFLRGGKLDDIIVTLLKKCR